MTANSDLSLFTGVGDITLLLSGGNSPFLSPDWFDITSYTAQTGFARLTVTYNHNAPIPEFCTMLLLGSGLAGLAGLRRKVKR